MLYVLHQTSKNCLYSSGGIELVKTTDEHFTQLPLLCNDCFKSGSGLYGYNLQYL